MIFSTTSSLKKDDFVFVPSMIFGISHGQFPEFKRILLKLIMTSPRAIPGSEKKEQTILRGQRRIPPGTFSVVKQDKRWKILKVIICARQSRRLYRYADDLPYVWRITNLEVYSKLQSCKVDGPIFRISNMFGHEAKLTASKIQTMVSLFQEFSLLGRRTEM